MNEPPSTKDTTHDPDDAPAEPIGSHMLEAVRTYESTGRLLGSLVATSTEHAHRNPDDESAAQVAKIVTAIEIAHRGVDLDSLALIKTLAGKADYYMRREPLRGPRTREEQAKMLLNAVAHELQWNWTAGQIAERFVMLLRIAPDIAKHTSVPASPGGWRDTDAEAEAVFTVESAIAEKLETANAMAVAKSALRALGCPDKTAQNFYR